MNTKILLSCACAALAFMVGCTDSGVSAGTQTPGQTSSSFNGGSSSSSDGGPSSNSNGDTGGMGCYIQIEDGIMCFVGRDESNCSQWAELEQVKSAVWQECPSGFLRNCTDEGITVYEYSTRSLYCEVIAE